MINMLVRTYLVRIKPNVSKKFLLHLSCIIYLSLTHFIPFFMTFLIILREITNENTSRKQSFLIIQNLI